MKLQCSFKQRCCGLYVSAESNTAHCLLLVVQARLWQVGKLMPQKLARHMEVRHATNPLSLCPVCPRSASSLNLVRHKG